MSFQSIDNISIIPINSQSEPEAATADIPILRLGGKDLSELSAGGVKVPLVSFVLVNFNYADFIGETIESIKRQDYTHFECLIVDNGSTDHSVSVVQSHIGEDKRFSLVQLNENLGQLGAIVWAIDHIKGSFVVFVDSDDLLFPSFCSTHIQAHLALPESVAFTSSNVIEINKVGDVLTGKYERIKTETPNFIKGLRPSSIVPRLSTIDDDTFELMSQNSAVIPKSEWGWCWSPGTSNMFRVSIVKLLNISKEFAIPNRSADSYFMNMAHVLAQSAVIDMSQSAYRVHGQNYFAHRESINSLRKYGADYARQEKLNNLQTMEIILARSIEFNWLAGNLWNTIEYMTKIYNRNEMSEYYRSAPVINLFVKYAERLSQSMPNHEFYAGVSIRFGLSKGLKIISASDDKHKSLNCLNYISIYFKKTCLSIFKKRPPQKQKK
jgi:glycosyltransferase involved in cell wall biosynthesis